MKCNRCPLEDHCPDLKKRCDVKEGSCPLEVAIAFIVGVAYAFVQKKK